jgi:hypothetical protein
MPSFLVSYDPGLRGQEYLPLKSALAAWTARKILYSEWLIRADTTAGTIYNDLAQHIREHDRLIVVRLAGEASWRSGGLMIADDEMQRLLEG